MNDGWHKARRARSRVNGFRIFLLAILAMAVVAFFVPLPYYVFSPGQAEAVAPIVRVQGGHRNERGSFMLTSVYVTYADNIYDFIGALMVPHHQVLSIKQVSGGLSNTLYDQIESYMMKQAKLDAELAAFRYLHKPYHLVNQGVTVVALDTKENPATPLMPGDTLLRINHRPIQTVADLTTVLASLHPGAAISVSVLRGGKIAHLHMHTVSLPDGAGKSHTGLGIYPTQALKLITANPVTIRTGQLDGPSAGLMFSLEIINQLAKTDLTRGYKIAGTGTITPNGVVGQIGGVTHKVIAAVNAGASFMFVPADRAPGDTNEAHALAEVKKDHLHITIVPVSTLAQAVSFLEKLPPKKAVK